MRKEETIIALATPAGRGGVGILRISGTLAQDVMQHVLKISLTPRMATYLPFYDENDVVMDEGIALFFPGPHSMTGEDILELQGHGSPVMLDMLIRRIISLGVRLARPGEFSERAFLNDKMDLTQAEAVADLIAASSQQAARSAVRSLQGEFAKEIHLLNEQIIHLRSYMEAAIDFVEEEIDFLSDANIQETFHTIIKQLILIQQKSFQGNLLREGITVVIAGDPNVGKSSLLNCLSGTEVAIVTNIPGTTRDVLRNHIQIDGLPLQIIDTAGLRDSSDVVEQEGIKRALQEIKKADVVLYMIEAQKPAFLLPGLFEDVSQPMLIVRNKIDLLNEHPGIETVNSQPTISLSAKTGAGLDLLKSAIKKMAGFHSSGEGIFLARRRHLDALAKAHEHLKNGLQQLNATRACELIAEDLRQAHLALCEITGVFTSDDLLGRIFSSFCIGK